MTYTRTQFRWKPFLIFFVIVYPIMILLIRYWMEQDTHGAQELIAKSPSVTGSIVSVSKSQRLRGGDKHYAYLNIKDGHANFSCQINITGADYAAFHAGQLKTLDVYYLDSKTPECWNAKQKNITATYNPKMQWIMAIIFGLMASIWLYIPMGLLPIKRLRKWLT